MNSYAYPRTQAILLSRLKSHSSRRSGVLADVLPRAENAHGRLGTICLRSCGGACQHGADSDGRRAVFLSRLDKVRRESGTFALSRWDVRKATLAKVLAESSAGALRLKPAHGGGGTGPPVFPPRLQAGPGGDS